MNNPFVYELIGYTASILVAISLLMSNILRLRVINLFGAICFMVYGLLIGAYPIAVVNFVIVLINIYFLHEMATAKEYFKLLEMRKDSAYLKHFLAFYDQEIKKFVPSFVYDPSAQLIVFFVLRNMVPAGLFMAEIRDKETLLAKLDFVIPGYRDFKVGKFVYEENSKIFTERGFRRIYTQPGNNAHEEYLRRMGFGPEGNSGLYVRKL